jgi:hypothetical protein
MLGYLTKLLLARPQAKCLACEKQEKYTLLDAAFDSLRGDFASDELRNSRLAICKGCEYLVMGSNCRLCGCFVHLKARYAAASCDIHKW